MHTLLKLIFFENDNIINMAYYGNNNNNNDDKGVHK